MKEMSFWIGKFQADKCMEFIYQQAGEEVERMSIRQ